MTSDSSRRETADEKVGGPVSLEQFGRILRRPALRDYGGHGIRKKAVSTLV